MEKKKTNGVSKNIDKAITFEGINDSDITDLVPKNGKWHTITMSVKKEKKYTYIDNVLVHEVKED